MNKHLGGKRKSDVTDESQLTNIENRELATDPGIESGKSQQWMIRLGCEHLKKRIST